MFLTFYGIAYSPIFSNSRSKYPTFYKSSGSNVWSIPSLNPWNFISFRITLHYHRKVPQAIISNMKIWKFDR